MVDVILSLVRTKSIGYLRDIRRWVVALSRARLGLYVVGRTRLFESCGEIEQTWNNLVSNGDQLELVSGEMWPTQRKVSSLTVKADNRLMKPVTRARLKDWNTWDSMSLP